MHFPAPVRVGLPAALQAELRAESIDGSLNLLAQAPFERQRLMVRELEAGRVYLLDVSAAAEGAPSGPVQDARKSGGKEENGSEPLYAMGDKGVGVNLLRYS